MRAPTMLAVALLVTGCEWGTTSRDELEASHEVMPAEDPAELVRGLADGIGPGVRYVELYVRSDMATAEVVHPDRPDRVVSYIHRGWGVDEHGFEALDPELDAATVGFTLEDVPVATLPALVGRARAAIPRPIASFSFLRVERDPPEGPPTITVYFDSFREGSARVVFDRRGEILEAHH